MQDHIGDAKALVQQAKDHDSHRANRQAGTSDYLDSPRTTNILLEAIVNCLLAIDEDIRHATRPRNA